MPYIYSIITQETRPTWEKESAQLEKIFPQLGNYFFTVKSC